MAQKFLRKKRFILPLVSLMLLASTAGCAVDKADFIDALNSNQYVEFEIPEVDGSLTGSFNIIDTKTPAQVAFMQELAGEAGIAMTTSSTSTQTTLKHSTLMGVLMDSTDSLNGIFKGVEDAKGMDVVNEQISSIYSDQYNSDQNVKAFLTANLFYNLVGNTMVSENGDAVEILRTDSSISVSRADAMIMVAKAFGLEAEQSVQEEVQMLIDKYYEGSLADNKDSIYTNIQDNIQYFAAVYEYGMFPINDEKSFDALCSGITNIEALSLIEKTAYGYGYLLEDPNVESANTLKDSTLKNISLAEALKTMEINSTGDTSKDTMNFLLGSMYRYNDTIYKGESQKGKSSTSKRMVTPALETILNVGNSTGISKGILSDGGEAKDLYSLASPVDVYTMLLNTSTYMKANNMSYTDTAGAEVGIDTNKPSTGVAGSEATNIGDTDPVTDNMFDMVWEMYVTVNWKMAGEEPNEYFSDANTLTDEGRYEAFEIYMGVPEIFLADENMDEVYATSKYPDIVEQYKAYWAEPENAEKAQTQIEQRDYTNSASGSTSTDNSSGSSTSGSSGSGDLGYGMVDGTPVNEDGSFADGIRPPALADVPFDSSETEEWAENGRNAEYYSPLNPNN